MDTGSPAGAYPAAAAVEENDFLDLIDGFESVYDVPFITVNRIDGQYVAEIITSLDDDNVTRARVQEALDVGHAHGVHAYARVWGEYNNLLIHFTPDTA